MYTYVRMYVGTYVHICNNVHLEIMETFDQFHTYACVRTYVCTITMEDALKM